MDADENNRAAGQAVTSDHTCHWHDHFVAEAAKCLAAEAEAALYSSELKCADEQLAKFERELEKKTAALEKAVEVIKEWHNLPIPGRSSFAEVDMEDTWRIYYENAPEMRLIRAALQSEEK
jgi:hypothetical protein